MMEHIGTADKRAPRRTLIRRAWNDMWLLLRGLYRRAVRGINGFYWEYEKRHLDDTERLVVRPLWIMLFVVLMGIGLGTYITRQRDLGVALLVLVVLIWFVPGIRTRFINLNRMQVARLKTVNFYLLPRVLFFTLTHALLALVGVVYSTVVALMLSIHLNIVLPCVRLYAVAHTRRLIAARVYETCPNRTCSHRGSPIHVCPTCHREHPKLEPNRYGVFYHECNGCAEKRPQKLPTLDVLGRNALPRVCSVCHTPLVARKRPEKLVALLGGRDAGKTAYLLMSALALTQNGQAKCANEEQHQFLEHFRTHNLKVGEYPDSTDETLEQAYQFWLHDGQRETVLYLYDAPGSMLSSIDHFVEQEFMRYLDGMILLVDPYSLEGLRGDAQRMRGDSELIKRIKPSETSPHIVAEAAINTVLRMHGIGQTHRIPTAVVITKADTPFVHGRLGDVSNGISPDKCRDALIYWGGSALIHLLEQSVEPVQYFACAALTPSDGRTRSTDAFTAHGVLEPLQWILNQ